MNLSYFKTREDAFSFLENYAFQKKTELDQKKLSDDLGLIKTYVLETSLNNSLQIDNNIFGDELSFHQVGDEDFYAFNHQGKLAGFLEFNTNRYILLHSFLHTKTIDKIIKNSVHNSSDLDNLWLSSDYYDCLWKNLIIPEWPDRFVKIKFEFENKFEVNGENGYFEGDQEIDFEEEASDDLAKPIDYERGASTTSITDRVKKMMVYLPEIQKYHPAFKTYKMLRIPSSARGGYEVWSWGKYTYRANSFLDGRVKLIYLNNVYARSTKIIEEALWFNIEKTNIKDSEGFKLTGAPFVLKFHKPLADTTFENLMNTTFDNNKGPLRLWGKPIRVSDYKYHIYGIDLHLWQKIFLEISREKILAILPKGTCGNSIHRLITNIKSYIDPEAEVFIADKGYSSILEKAFVNNDN